MPIHSARAALFSFPQHPTPSFPQELATRLQKRKDMKGWQEMYDKASGATYYYKKETGQTQWDAPVQVPAC